jgi:hypothetical protein
MRMLPRDRDRRPIALKRGDAPEPAHATNVDPVESPRPAEEALIRDAAVIDNRTTARERRSVSRDTDPTPPTPRFCRGAGHRFTQVHILTTHTADYMHQVGYHEFACMGEM